MTDEEIEELRRPCLEMLAMLRESYDKAAAPYIQRLVDIENVRPIRFLAADLPDGVLWLSAGPRPEQNAIVTGLSDSADGVDGKAGS